MPTLLSVGEYLRTLYRPVCDYVDGELVARRASEFPDGRVKRELVVLFAENMRAWQVEALPRVTLQISPTRFRVPDVSVIGLASNDEMFLSEAPLLCIEVVAREDHVSKVLERLADDRSIGVPAVWVFNPWQRKAFVASADGGLDPAAEVLTLAGTLIRIEVAEVFSALDPLAE